ncbi:glycosyltransferase [Roseiconus lacunae]|uniref:glycosyltransferase n=1 Tax=Roseiconus lacunae TaxID=2605694 RepID=UPI001E2AF99E|nr:glycosyltransferase [Roseiconus lacunae]MCD0458885.1 glycosyltransferase [Roseiconus lacunae]
MLIYSWPGLAKTNPYQELFYHSLEKHGFRFGGQIILKDTWIAAKDLSNTILHFHWPEAAWRWRGPRLHDRIRGLIGFYQFLNKSRRAGAKICWTVHNLEHHEGADKVDRWAYAKLAEASDLLICHSTEVGEEIARRYQTGDRTLVMRHGTYETAYPAPRERERTLGNLGLSTSVPTLVQLGALREYKGLDIALSACEKLDGRIQLIIAGGAGAQFDARPLCERARKVASARVLDHFIDDQLFADFAGASSGFLLPYRKVTGSGAALASLTFGKGIVASDLPFFRTLVGSAPHIGTLFHPDSVGDCVRAIERFLSLPQDRVSADCEKVSQDYQWDNCVIPVANRLRSLSS